MAPAPWRRARVATRLPPTLFPTDCRPPRHRSKVLLPAVPASSLKLHMHADSRARARSWLSCRKYRDRKCDFLPPARDELRLNRTDEQYLCAQLARAVDFGSVDQT